MNRNSKRIESNTEETADMIGSNVMDLFKNVRYHPSGDLDNEVSELLEVGGAKYCQYLCHLCTHCIVGKSADDAEMEEAIDVYGIPAVSQDWVLGSVKCGKLFPTAAFSPSKDQLMSGVRVCISGVGRKDACSIFAMVTFYGGWVDPLLTEATTHLVTTKDRGECYENALARTDVFVVTPDWVSDSVRDKIKCIEMIYHPRLLVTSPQMVNDGVETVCKEEAHISSPQRIGKYQCQLPPCHSNECSTEKEEAEVFTTPQQSILSSEAVNDGFEKQLVDVQKNTAFNSLQDLAIPLDHNYSNASKMETATEIMDEASKEAVVVNEKEPLIIEMKTATSPKRSLVRKGRKRVSWCLDFSTSPERKTPILSQPTNKKSKHKNKAKKEDLKIEDYMGGLEKISPARCRRTKSTDTTNPLKKDKPIKDSTNIRAKRAVVKRFVSSDSDTLVTNIQSERQNQNKRYSKSRKKVKNKDKKEDLKIKDFKGGLKNPPKKEKVMRDWKKIVRAKRSAMTCQSDSDTPAIDIQTELQNKKQYFKRKKCVPTKTKVTTTKRGLTKNSEMTSVSGLDSPTIIKQTELQNLQKQYSKSEENPISVDHNQNMERTVRQHSNIKIISFNQGTQIKQVAESYRLPQVSTSTSQPDSICTSTKTFSTAQLAMKHTGHFSSHTVQLEEGKLSGDYNSSPHGNFTSHKSQVTEKKVRDYNPTPLAVSTSHTNPILTKGRVYTGNFSSHASQSAGNKQAGDCDPPPLVVSRHPTIFTSPMMPPSNSRILTSMYLKLPPHTSTFPRQDSRVDPLGVVMNQQECLIRRQAPLSNQQDSLPVTVENLPASVPATSEENKKLPLYWTVEETIKGVSLVDPKLSSHVQIFRSHEIDGRALLMLDLEMMIKYLDMKVGPALKLSNIIEKLKRD